jgi:hypothetical protein
VLPEDFSDDGQPFNDIKAHFYGIRGKHGMQFFSDYGNHDRYILHCVWQETILWG